MLVAGLTVLRAKTELCTCGEDRRRSTAMTPEPGRWGRARALT